MDRHHDIPTHLAVPDRPLLGLTAPQLLVLASGAFSCIAALRQPHAPLGLRLAEGLVALGLTTPVALVRPRGRSLLAWGRVAVAHATGPRALVWAGASSGAPAVAPEARDDRCPPHLAGRFTPAPAPTPTARATDSIHRHPSIQGYPLVPTWIDDDIVVFGDGRQVAVLECGGPDTSLMDGDALATLHAQYHAFLVGLRFPAQFLVSATPADLRGYTMAREGRLTTLPLALRRLESGDISYMGREARRLGVVDQRVFVAIAALGAADRDVGRPLNPLGPLALLRRAGRCHDAPSEDGGLARVLDERCAQVATALRSVGVHAWRLRTAGLRDLWYRRLCPRSALLQPLEPAHGAPAVARIITFADNTDDAKPRQGGAHVQR